MRPRGLSDVENQVQLVVQCERPVLLRELFEHAESRASRVVIKHVDATRRSETVGYPFLGLGRRAHIHATESDHLAPGSTYLGGGLFSCCLTEVASHNCRALGR